MCHSMAPVLTNESDVKGWRAIYAWPPMPQSGLTEKQIETLVHYLAFNAPISPEDVPKELIMYLDIY